uniref:LIM zinc-binding domain-containing protein n=1 Tax=Chelonoidis abingdonii TaxID=106734 RepID=A0A8C0GNB0_CHEAB
SNPSGRCARCGENVVGDGTGCVAMDQVFHVPCFTCTTCHARLRGQPFYAMERRAYCEACYVVSAGRRGSLPGERGLGI